MSYWKEIGLGIAWLGAVLALSFLLTLTLTSPPPPPPPQVEPCRPKPVYWEVPGRPNHFVDWKIPEDGLLSVKSPTLWATWSDKDVWNEDWTSWPLLPLTKGLWCGDDTMYHEQGLESIFEKEVTILEPRKGSWDLTVYVQSWVYAEARKTSLHVTLCNFKPEVVWPEDFEGPPLRDPALLHQRGYHEALCFVETWDGDQLIERTDPEAAMVTMTGLQGRMMSFITSRERAWDANFIKGGAGEKCPFLSALPIGHLSDRAKIDARAWVSDLPGIARLTPLGG